MSTVHEKSDPVPLALRSPKERADALLEKGRFREAANLYGSLVGRHSDQVGVLLGLGRAFCRLGDWAGMQACLETVLTIDPSNECASANLNALQQGSGTELQKAPRIDTWFNLFRPSDRLQDDLVYDVGMNNGDDTAYYLHRGFRVVAVEADPDLCQVAAARFEKEVRDGRLQIVNLGIAAKPGVLDFWICEKNRVWNSFDRKIASRDGLPHHSIQIPCQTFGWILANYGIPHFLKIDIEGHDYLCIEALKGASDLPAYLSVELGNLDRFLVQLTELGYSGFKCISQYHFLPLQLPPVAEQLALEAGRASGLRQFNGWSFPEGTSGAFGEDTLGRWLDREEVARTHSHYLRLRDQQEKTPFWFGAGYSFWLDLHAKREIRKDSGDRGSNPHC